MHIAACRCSVYRVHERKVIVLIGVPEPQLQCPYITFNMVCKYDESSCSYFELPSASVIDYLFTPVRVVPIQMPVYIVI